MQAQPRLRGAHRRVHARAPLQAGEVSNAVTGSRPDPVRGHDPSPSRSCSPTSSAASRRALLVLFVMSALVFAGVYAIGNPIDILINPQADQAEIARATAALGLDKPLPVQYWTFLTSALRRRARPLVRRRTCRRSSSSSQRMPATIELALTAMVIAIVLGIPLGLVGGAEARHRSPARRSWRARSSASACRRSGSG